MDKILNKLYYDDKLGVAGKANFIKKVRVLHHGEAPPSAFVGQTIRP
jgi:hypothetical protein